jgi:peroxisomal 2,4-dienoyl-CoA reductase
LRPFFSCAICFSSGKIAVVTGGGSGIGFAIAKQLGLHGARILIAGRTQTRLDEAVKQLKTHGVTADSVVCDVRDPNQCAKLAEKAGNAIDILVNNAAGNFLALAEHLSPNAFKVDRAGKTE